MRYFIKILTRARRLCVIISKGNIYGQMKSGLSVLETPISQAATEPLANGILVAFKHYYNTKKA